MWHQWTDPTPSFDLYISQAGYHCVLRWFWDDPSGEAREARVSALGGKKRIAKAEAMRRMLQEQGFEALEVSALNEAKWRVSKHAGVRWTWDRSNIL